MDEYEERLKNEFDRLQQVKNMEQQPFESPEAISKHLLEVNEYVSNGVNLDSARANLNPSELRETRAKGHLLLELEEAEKICGWELPTLKEKVFGKLGVTNVTSRGKGGWASVLSKTDKQVNVQSMTPFAEDISDQFSEQASQGLKEKVMSKIPFLKKKE